MACEGSFGTWENGQRILEKMVLGKKATSEALCLDLF